MKSTLSYLLILCSLFMSCTGHQEESLLSYVDTRTGTAPSITHTAGLFGKNTEEVILVRQKGYENKSFFWFADSEMLKEFIRIAPEMKIKVNASNIAALKKWMKICTPAYVETDILNITPQFKEFCKSNHIKIMAAIQNASEKEYKKAIEAHPDLVNLDRPELFVNMLRQEIKK